MLPHLRIGEWRPMASMRMRGVLTWALEWRLKAPGTSRLEGTDLNTGVGFRPLCCYEQRIGQSAWRFSPGAPPSSLLPPPACFPSGSMQHPLPSPSVATPGLGLSNRQALAEPMGGCASQRRQWTWRQRAQGASPDALGVGAGAAARAEGQARSASLQPEPGAASR